MVDMKLAKLRLLEMHYEAKVGHIGGNLSCLDIIMTLYHEVLTDKDHFFLSKGHAAGAYYVTMWTKGSLCDDCLKTFHKDQGLPGHLPNSGSLGHGLGISVGIALSMKLRRQPGLIYVLMSDGEWDEGSNWESLKFIVDNDIQNIKIIVDCNELQGFKRTSLIYDRFKSYVSTTSIDGHDPFYIEQIKTCDATLFLARTVKGKGVSFMENKMEWHYLPMTEEQYHQAIKEVLDASSAG